jgi:YesN/AraC family two-component response regulator
MDLLKLLWVDLSLHPSSSGIFLALKNSFQIHVLAELTGILDVIRAFSPGLVCFEYDYPERSGLRALQKTKARFPKLPILMLTGYHSEALAVWALRTRVWDYLVKPVSAEEVSCRIDRLSRPANIPGSNLAESEVTTTEPIPFEVRVFSPTERQITLPAVSYVEKHYSDKIELGVVSGQCGLRPGQFSRIFKKERGVTFREFLIRYRINKARELLRHPRASVTDVAFTVGFSDLSYFARIFKKHTGASPSHYRPKNGQPANSISR